MTLPDYSGGSLVNLVAEVEHRLTGRARGERLHEPLRTLIPEGTRYVLVLFDGLGTHQLAHDRAARLQGDMQAAIDAPFPTTTTTSLATIATGLTPSQHGLLGYQLWLPEHDVVVNTIKWTTLWGRPVPYDYDRFLPRPNLWERLADAGGTAITVQPAHFAGTPLSRVLYRGARFEPADTQDEIVSVTGALVRAGHRFVLVYLPHVDFAAHTFGQESESYRQALEIAAAVWEGISAEVTPGTIVLGTADHGHIDFPEERRVKLAKGVHKGRQFYGDGRAMFVLGEGASLAGDLPATWVPRDDLVPWWGPPPRHDAFSDRAPDGALVADEGWILLHRFSDERLIGNHGGLSDAERLVPLLVAGS